MTWPWQGRCVAEHSEGIDLKNAIISIALALIMCVSGLFAFFVPVGCDDHIAAGGILGPASNSDLTRRTYHPAVFDDYRDEGNGADGGTRTTLVDSEIVGYNNWCAGWTLEMLGGSNKGQESAVSDYYALTHTITVAPPFDSPIAKGDTYRIYLTEYDAMNIYYLCAQNMSQDVRYMDLLPHISNGDSDTIGFVGQNKVDINNTWTESHRMNFSYPRAGMAQANKGLYCEFDDKATVFCNLTLNSLNIPVKELNIEIWFDTDGNYNIMTDTGDIEGKMAIDFDPDTPGLDYATTVCPGSVAGRQMEEYADGVGVWTQALPAGEEDMKSGQIFVTIWRSDMISEDNDPNTVDLLMYCGFTGKLSWLNLPYKHPDVNPHADAGSEQGYNSTLGQPILRERTDVFFDATHSYDPQDDTGLDGIAFGDAGYTGPDTFEANKNIDNGDPVGEATGETDRLQYKWSWGIGTQDSGWLSTPHATHQFTLPSKVPVMIFRVTLTVRDPQMHTDTAHCYIQVWDDPGTPPLPTISVAPDETPGDHETTVLAGQEFAVTGHALDVDEGQTLVYYWDLDNSDLTHEPSDISEFTGPGDRNGTTGFSMRYAQTGEYRLTLNVFDGPIGTDDTLNATDHYMIHVVNNTPPSGSILARLSLGSEPIVDNAYVRDYEDLYFEASATDPDLRPGFDPNGDHIIDYQVQYKWDFGDGKAVEWTTQNEMSHNYSGKGSANNGYQYYTVVVIVRDGPEKDPHSEIVTLAPFKVYVNMAPVADAGSDLPSIEYDGDIQTLDIVHFDASRSYDPNDDLNGDGVISSSEVDNLQYSWNFGDGAAGGGVRPTHIYEKAGIYTAQLTVKDMGGRTGTDSLTVTVVEIPKTPIIDINVGSQDGQGNTMEGYTITVLTKEDIVFDATGSYAPDGDAYTDDKASTDPSEDLLFVWEFGPDSKTSAPKVTYSYPEDGDYTVTLTVTDMAHPCAPSVVITITVHVLNRAPIADMGNFEGVNTGQEALFDGKDSSDMDGSVVQYSWDFGDEYKSGWQNESRTKHIYEKPGIYRVKLIVKDNDGSESVADGGNITVTGDIIDQHPDPQTGIITAVVVIIILLAIGIGITFAVVYRLRK